MAADGNFASSASSQTIKKNGSTISQLNSAVGRSSCSSSNKLGTFVALASTAAKLFAGGCNVAQEVYCIKNLDWIKFRYWMYHQSPKYFKIFYMKYSLPISKCIQDKPVLKKIIKYFMDKQIKKVTYYD